jgi:hypothetical protein
MSLLTRPRLITAAIATALGSNVYALPPSHFTDGTINEGNFFYAAGGSGQVNAVFAAVRRLLVPASVDVYTDALATAGHLQSANYLIVSGTTSGAGQLGFGTAIAFFYKYNDGDFVDGVFPQVGNGSSLLYPLPADLANAVAVSPVPVFASTDSPTYTYSSQNGFIQKVPDWGLSSAEPSLFNFFDNLNGLPQQNPILAAHQMPAFVSAYGVAVTTAVSEGAHPKTKFTKAEVANILAGTISDWSQLYADDGSRLPAGAIWLLDSGSGSGTKTVGNQYFLNYPGAITTGGSVTPNSVVGTNVNAYTGTVLNTSSAKYQDVKEPSDVAIVRDLLVANKAGHGAIAILSLEFPPVFAQNTSGTNDYMFVAINGVFPDSNSGTKDNINNPNAVTPGTTQYSNIILGTYDFAYQTSLNMRIALFDQPAFESAVLLNLISENISGAHTGSVFPVSAPGVLLDPVSTEAHDAGNLVWSRHQMSTGSAVLINDATVIGVGGVVFGPGDPL